MIGSALATLGRLAPVALPVGVVIGLVLPDLATLARPLFAPSLVGMLAVSLMRLDGGVVLGRLRQPLPLALAVAWLLILCPALVALIARPVLDPTVAAAVILYAASPPVLVSLAYALMLGLDATLALVVLLGATFISPFTVPPLYDLLVGIDIALSTGDLMARLALLIVGAAVLARLARWLWGAARVAEARYHLDGAIVIFMTVFAVSIMDGVTARLLDDPLHVTRLVAIAFAVNLGLQAMTLVALPLLGGPAVATLGMMSGHRNMGLLMAALGEAADQEVFLFFALAQLPIYFLPVILRPVYRRVAALGDTA